MLRSHGPWDVGCRNLGPQHLLQKKILAISCKSFVVELSFN